MSSRIPMVSVQNPVGSSRIPMVSVQNPVGSSRIPMVLVQNPVGSSRIPMVSVQNPVGSSRIPMVSVQNPVGSSRVPIVPVQNPIGSICAECHRFPVFQNTQFCSKACRSGAPKCHVCAKEPCYYDWTQQQYSSCCSRTCLNIRRTKNGCRICGAVPYPGS